jgi:hypothetical protein
MHGLTATLLGRACHTFLVFAYPGGWGTIPPPRRVFGELLPDADPTPLLVPPLCEVLRTPTGCIRGYAIRLGSAAYPHLKLRVDAVDDGATCVFAVDTHDALRLDPSHPDAPGWVRLQAYNRMLKHAIERAWEGQELLTFNGLLRRDLSNEN